MWQFVYSNAAPDDESVDPPFPAQPEEGDLGRLMQAIESGAPIRVGMRRSGTIHYSVFTVENVRYWKTDDDTDYVALASLVNLYHTLAIAIVDTKGNERFWQPGNPTPWLSPHPRVFRWYADI